MIIFDEGKVVESYSIKDNNYDIKAFEKFLKKEEIIKDVYKRQGKAIEI